MLSFAVGLWNCGGQDNSAPKSTVNSNSENKKRFDYLALANKIPIFVNSAAPWELENVSTGIY